MNVNLKHKEQQLKTQHGSWCTFQLKGSRGQYSSVGERQMRPGLLKVESAGQDLPFRYLNLDFKMSFGHVQGCH